ncbi:E3 ubiquitin-protein ligase RHF2A isoform X5 [Vigna angularis]|uniref:E3 ubiquitin-protein ligase RHF2A isoform X5 n=1 Tax=Phaseolus angularis TaxID=3914 RepID=UPI0022B59274|nr:E3 ubiquitin-protein ligase RHF2A isoform X5 [Vigna angularis]
MMPAAYALKPSVTVILPRLPVASMSFIFSAFSNGLKIPALEYVNANDSRGLYQQPISYCSFKSLYRHCLRHFIDLWCQRSSQCPMCWQPISLKDPTSQELLEAVERERNFRINPPRNATIFHHPTLGDFELQHLPVGASDADLEERIIQHLAAAAAMGRARHIARREGQRNRSSAQGEQSSQLTLVAPVQAEQVSASGSGSSALGTEHQGSSYNNRRSPNQSSPSSQDRAGPSELQSFSESLKSKLNAVSSRYKESISKSTRGWKERWFSRNNAMSDIGSDVRREVNAGIATVSRMMERLETRDSNRSNINSAPSNLEDDSVQGPNDQALTGTERLLGDNNTKASCAAGSSSS